MVGRRSKKGMRRWIEELRSLLAEYDYLLMVSDVLGVPVSEEGEMLRDVIDQHPEYEGFLPGEEIEVEDGTTVNPRLHIAVEAAVQTQIAKDDPPEAREAYLTLLGAGMDGHEARHAIGRVFVETVWLVLQNRLTADPNTYYRNQLRELERQKLDHEAFAP